MLLPERFGPLTQVRDKALSPKKPLLEFSARLVAHRSPVLNRLRVLSNAGEWGLRDETGGFACWLPLSGIGVSWPVHVRATGTCHRKQSKAARIRAKKVATTVDTKLGSWNLQRFRGIEAASPTLYQTLWSFQGTTDPGTTSSRYMHALAPVSICDGCHTLDLFGRLGTIKAQCHTSSFAELRGARQQAVSNAAARSASSWLQGALARIGVGS